MSDSKSKKKNDDTLEGAATATAEPQKTEGVLYLGIDFGTTGCRASLLDQHQRLLTEARIPLTPAIPPAAGHH